MTCEIRPLGTRDVDALGCFFETIAIDEKLVGFFHPHAFDRPMAERICRRTAIQQDEYFAAFDAEQVVGYGMLRGWDEGYSTPAFGVCVLPLYQGRGIGACLLDYAIGRATTHGSSRIMLKVRFDNDAAKRLYDGRGFEFTGREADQLVGYKSLD